MYDEYLVGPNKIVTLNELCTDLEQNPNDPIIIELYGPGEKVCRALFAGMVKFYGNYVALRKEFSPNETSAKLMFRPDVFEQLLSGRVSNENISNARYFESSRPVGRMSSCAQDTKWTS